MFRQQGRDDEREPVSRPLPPDISITIGAAPVLPASATPRRLPAHSRDERRLARIDRKVAARDTPTV
jgi:hypothetical protein